MLRSATLAILLAGLLGVACPSPAAADTLTAQDKEWVNCADWYGPEEGLSFLMEVRRTDADPRFPNGATLRLSVLDIEQASNATLGLNVVDDPVVLPDDWRERPDPEYWPYWVYDVDLWTGPVGTDVITVTWGVSVDGGHPIPFVQRITNTTEPCDRGSHPPYPPTPTPWPGVTPPPTPPTPTPWPGVTPPATATDDRDGSSPWPLTAPLLLLVAVGGVAILGTPRRRQRG